MEGQRKAGRREESSERLSPADQRGESLDAASFLTNRAHLGPSVRTQGAGP